MSNLRLFILIVVFGAATTAAFAQRSSNINTSGWSTYRNDNMGFEVKYPQAWRVQMPTGTGPENVLMNEPRVAGKETLSIQFWVQRKINPKAMSIEQWYAFQLAGNKSAPISRTLLGGRPTIRREVTGSLGQNFDFFASLNDSDVFEVTISQPVAKTTLDPIYEAILSTVKFIG